MLGEIILIIFGFLCGSCTGGLIVSLSWLYKIKQWEKDGKLKWK